MLFLSGSPTHRATSIRVIDDLHAFMSDHPDAELTVLGHSESGGLPRLGAHELPPAVSYTDMIKFIGGFDIVIVPFEKTVFNYAKIRHEGAGGRLRRGPGHRERGSGLRPGGPRNAHAGYIVPWGTNWRTVLEQAYANREADRASFHRLVQFAELRSSGLRGGSELLTAFCTLHRNVICLPPTYRATGTNRESAMAARA